MILKQHRKLAQLLVRIKAFYFYEHMRCQHLYARKGFGWLLDYMKRRQTTDGLHHAPACPGNEWERMALVYRRCTCGARPNPRAEVK